MHSQLALTEHVSLNLAPLILLDPVHVRFSDDDNEPSEANRPISLGNVNMEAPDMTGQRERESTN